MGETKQLQVLKCVSPILATESLGCVRHFQDTVQRYELSNAHTHTSYILDKTFLVLKMALESYLVLHLQTSPAIPQIYLSRMAPHLFIVSKNNLNDSLAQERLGTTTGPSP